MSLFKSFWYINNSWEWL